MGIAVHDADPHSTHSRGCVHREPRKTRARPGKAARGDAQPFADRVRPGHFLVGYPVRIRAPAPGGWIIARDFRLHIAPQRGVAQHFGVDH